MNVMNAPGQIGNRCAGMLFCAVNVQTCTFHTIIKPHPLKQPPLQPAETPFELELRETATTRNTRMCHCKA